jgi:hypothetical protein
MSEKIKFGIFGSGEVTREDDGTIEMFAVVQESGLFGGAPPAELRIRDLVPQGKEFAKQWCARLNRDTDLPFYLTKAKVKVIGKMEEIKDEDLIEAGIEPLAE